MLNFCPIIKEPCRDDCILKTHNNIDKYCLIKEILNYVLFNFKQQEEKSKTKILSGCKPHNN